MTKVLQELVSNHLWDVETSLISFWGWAWIVLRCEVNSHGCLQLKYILLRGLAVDKLKGRVYSLTKMAEKSVTITSERHQNGFSYELGLRDDVGHNCTPCTTSIRSLFPSVRLSVCLSVCLLVRLWTNLCPLHNFHNIDFNHFIFGIGDDISVVTVPH